MPNVHFKGLKPKTTRYNTKPRHWMPDEEKLGIGDGEAMHLMQTYGNDFVVTMQHTEHDTERKLKFVSRMKGEQPEFVESNPLVLKRHRQPAYFVHGDINDFNTGEFEFWMRKMRPYGCLLEAVDIADARMKIEPVMKLKGMKLWTFLLDKANNEFSCKFVDDSPKLPEVMAGMYAEHPDDALRVFSDQGMKVNMKTLSANADEYIQMKTQLVQEQLQAAMQESQKTTESGAEA